MYSAGRGALSCHHLILGTDSPGRGKTAPPLVKKLGKRCSANACLSPLFEEWLMSGQNWKNSKMVTSLSQKQYEAYTGKRRWMLRSEVEARFLVCSTCGARTTQQTTLTNASSNIIGQYLVPICGIMLYPPCLLFFGYDWDTVQPEVGQRVG